MSEQRRSLTPQKRVRGEEQSEGGSDAEAGPQTRFCPLLTRHEQSVEERQDPNLPEIRAYKLGKRRWSYNQCEVRVRQDGGPQQLEVAEAVHYANAPLSEWEQESAVAYQVLLSNGQRIIVVVYCVYDECQEVELPPAAPGGQPMRRFQWPAVSRAHCRRGCEGAILRAIQRFGKQGRRSGGSSAQGGAQDPQGGAERMKDASHLYLSLDEAGTHVGARRFRLILGAYDHSGRHLLGCSCSPPIRVLANNDVPTGAAFIPLHLPLSRHWRGWQDQRVPDKLLRPITSGGQLEGAAAGVRHLAPEDVLPARPKTGHGLLHLKAKGPAVPGASSGRHRSPKRHKSPKREPSEERPLPRMAPPGALPGDQGQHTHMPPLVPPLPLLLVGDPSGAPPPGGASPRGYVPPDPSDPFYSGYGLYYPLPTSTAAALCAPASVMQLYHSNLGDDLIPSYYPLGDPFYAGADLQEPLHSRGLDSGGAGPSSSTAGVGLSSQAPPAASVSGGPSRVPAPRGTPAFSLPLHLLQPEPPASSSNEAAYDRVLDNAAWAELDASWRARPFALQPGGGDRDRHSPLRGPDRSAPAPAPASHHTHSAFQWVQGQGERTQPPRGAPAFPPFSQDPPPTTTQPFS